MRKKFVRYIFQPIWKLKDTNRDIMTHLNFVEISAQIPFGAENSIAGLMGTFNALVADDRS